MKSSWRKSLEHVVIGAVLITSAATWAPSCVAGSWVVEAGVNQALAWAEPDQDEPASLLARAGQKIHESAYTATRATVEAVARMMTWTAVFIGLLLWGLIEIRYALLRALDGILGIPRLLLTRRDQ
jgi:hypothetical protein